MLQDAKLYWTKLHCVRKLMEPNRDWFSVFNPVVPYKLLNAQNQSQLFCPGSSPFTSNICKLRKSYRAGNLFIITFS